MRSSQLVGLSVAAIVSILVCGCRVNPIMLPAMLAGAALDEAALRECTPELIGQAPEMADAMFGRRLDTYSDVGSDAKLLLYLVANEKSLGSRYVVAVKGDKITALYKTQHDIDGLADAIQTDVIKSKVLGKTADAVERDTDLGQPEVTMRCQRKAGLTRIYDARKYPNLQGARYCALQFGADGRCRDVRMFGVTASSQTGESKE